MTFSLWFVRSTFVLFIKSFFLTHMRRCGTTFSLPSKQIIVVNIFANAANANKLRLKSGVERQKDCHTCNYGILAFSSIIIIIIQCEVDDRDHFYIIDSTIIWMRNAHACIWVFYSVNTYRHTVPSFYDRIQFDWISTESDERCEEIRTYTKYLRNEKPIWLQFHLSRPPISRYNLIGCVDKIFTMIHLNNFLS